MQMQRNGADRADIGRHIVASRAVAPRHGTEQGSVFVGERDGRAVEFELADELRLSELFLDASDEFVQLVERIGVTQRKHRKAVLDALEFGREIASDAGRRGVRVGVFRMCRLQLLQFAHQDVEFPIGYFRPVFDVVFMVVVVECAT